MAEPTKVKFKFDSVLEDPGVNAIAKVYAEAFLNAAPVDQIATALDEFRTLLDDVLENNPEFGRLMTSPMISRDDKLGIINRAYAGRASDLFTNFLRVLARHNRLDILRPILAECGVLFEKKSGRQRVQITSAQPLSEKELQDIQSSLAAKLPFQPILETAVDPALLGGLRIRVGDTVYDGSLRARFNQLRHRVRERSLHEIQSGRNRFSSPEGN